jgi:hypothetical protein
MLDKIRIIKERINIPLIVKSVPRKQIFFGALGVILITGFLHNFIIDGQLKKLKALELKFNSKKNLLDFYGRLTKQEKTELKEKTETGDDAVTINGMFIPEEELSGYFTNFRALVKSHNLEVVLLDFKPGDAESGQYAYFERLPFAVSIKGDCYSVMALLSELEKNNPVLDIKSVRIYKDGFQDYGVVMDILASIYILKKSI